MRNISSQSEISLQMQIPGIFSIIGCLMIITVYLAYPSLRCKRHIELVFYVALNDLVASVGACFGFVESGWQCSFQSFSTTYNYLVSMFWSVVISYQLYVIVGQGDFSKDLQFAHMICWILPLILTLIPLSTSSYGLEDDNWGWCYLISKPGFSNEWLLLWSFIGFYMWVWLCIAAIALLFCLVIHRLRRQNSFSLLFSENLYRLGLYPLVFIICWGIPSFISIYRLIRHDESEPSTQFRTLDGISHILPPSQGFWLSLLFFYNNKLVWRTVIRRRNLLADDMKMAFDNRDSEVDASRISSSTLDLDSRYTEDILGRLSLQNFQIDQLKDFENERK